MADVKPEPRRRLWWRHVLSFLRASRDDGGDTPVHRGFDRYACTGSDLSAGWAGDHRRSVDRRRVGLFVWTNTLFIEQERARWGSAKYSESLSIWWCAARTGACAIR